MKSINRIFGSFIIVCLALVSCEKEKHPQGGDPEQPAVVVRTIKVSFDTKSTRTELVGEQPYFKDGDLIRMAQVDGGAEPQVCTVKVENSNASVETTLQGKLKAVYPYDCAAVSGNIITGINVPTSQDGTFAKAHICLAEQESDDDESLTFHNQTPILRFYVDESIQVQSITISGISNPITVKPSSGFFTTSNLDGPDKRICYAAVPSGINANSFTFTSTTGTQGTVEQTLKATTSLANGTMYNIFIPYYIDLGDAGKWAYCNIGAFLPEEFGLYFAWGATKGYNATEGEFYLVFEDAECDFSRENYTSPQCINNVLKLENDAAHINWGGAWRMPTYNEFATLSNYYSQEIVVANIDVGNGYIFTVAGKDIFLPKAGYGDGKDTLSYGYWGYLPRGLYWSSTRSETTPYCLRIEEIFEDDPDYPYASDDPEYYDSYLFHSVSNHYAGYYGMPIRPIYVGGDNPDTNITGGSLDPYGKDTETF